jgi:hypothetical protein
VASRTPRRQLRSQYNPHWGEYATAADLPNTAGAPLAASEFSLQAGDLAFVTGDGTYECLSAGGAAATPAAVWQKSGGGAASVAPLWEWNGVDTTQFGAPRYFADSLNVQAGTASLSVVPSPFTALGLNMLRVTGIGPFRGGVFFPILGLTLPSRYVMNYTPMSFSGSGLISFMGLSMTGAGIVRGLGHARSFASGGTNSQIAQVANNRLQANLNLEASGTATQSNLNAGETHRMDVWRLVGSATEQWRVSAESNAGNVRSGGNVSFLVNPIGADWNGVDGDVCGPGVQGGGSVATLTMDYLDMRIYSFPLPAP